MRECDRNPKFGSRREMHRDRQKMADEYRKVEKLSPREPGYERAMNKFVAVSQEHGLRLRKWFRKEGRNITWRE